MITRKCAIGVASQSWVAWTQPVLSANGVLGGANFACNTNHFFNNSVAYRMFDNNSTTFYSCTAPTEPMIEITFYNPTAIKVTKITTLNRSGYNCAITAGSVKGSNDGTNWLSLCTFTNNNVTGGSSWDINVNSNTAYKYHKVVATSVTTSSGFLAISGETITATYQA